MDNNAITEYTDITKAVYESLSNSITQIEKLQQQEDALTKKINSNMYSQDYVRSDLMPQRDEASLQLKRAIASALDSAESMVSQYKAVAERKNALDPEQLTDDIKLLQPNIHLEPRDILDILERNKNNRTMLQITLRYAKANGIDLKGNDGKYWRPNETEILVKTLTDQIHYAGKWLKTPNAKKMLDKFFGIA